MNRDEDDPPIVIQEISYPAFFLELSSAAAQCGFSFLIEWLPNLITLYILAHTGRSDYIAGFGLGVTWVTCLGISMILGIASGLETMIAQAFGARKYALCASIYNRILCFLTVLMLPIFLVQVLEPQILGIFNSNTQLLQEAAIYTRSVLPAIYLNAIFVCTKCFLNGQNIYHYQLYTSIISTTFHAFWCYIYIVVLDLGILGCALARNTTELVNNILLFSMIFYSKCSTNCLSPLSIDHFSHWGPLLKVAIPIGATIWLEWITFEFYIIQASFLDNPQVVCQVTLITMDYVYYQIAYGISIATTSFVGIEMGKRRVLEAKAYSKLSIVLVTITLSITLIPAVIYKDRLMKLFVQDEEVEFHVQRVYYLWLFYQMLDGYQIVSTGIVRAIGKEKFAVYSMIVVNSFFGQLLSIYLTFIKAYGLLGIWIAMCTAMFLFDVLQFGSIITADWTEMLFEIEAKQNRASQAQPSDLEAMFGIQKSQIT